MGETETGIDKKKESDQVYNKLQNRHFANVYLARYLEKQETSLKKSASLSLYRES